MFEYAFSLRLNTPDKPQSDDPQRKVLLIGWDSADWKAINPLIDAGKMPNLARFIENCAHG